ncbi:MAG: hypothetical protein PHT76_11705 [Anaerostipes sp.]|nr:hypothetical protein [Anaerostipes sp.]
MNIYYKNNKNQVIYLSKWPIMLQNPEELYNYKWDYETKNNRISSFESEVQEKSLELSFFADSKEEFEKIFNGLYEITEYDIVQEIPGKLYINEQYMNCYIISEEITTFDYEMESIDTKIKVVTDEPKWLKGTMFTFRPLKRLNANLDYEYDYEYDYMADRIIDSFENNSAFPCEFRLVIYGSCVFPSVFIGGHEYSLSITLEDNEYLVIDSIQKTITKYENDGTEDNIYNYRSRDSYIFEKIQNGTVSVLSDGEFGFDLTVFEERSKPKWT